MDDCDVDYSLEILKQNLLEKVIEAVDHVVPQEEETYTYTEQVVDTTTLQSPTWKESTFKLG